MSYAILSRYQVIGGWWVGKDGNGRKDGGGRKEDVLVGVFTK